MRCVRFLVGRMVDCLGAFALAMIPRPCVRTQIVASSRANRTSLHGAPPTPKGGQRRGSSGGDGGLAAHHRELLSSVRGTLRDIGVDMARYDQDNQYQADYLNTQSKFLQELKVGNFVIEVSRSCEFYMQDIHYSGVCVGVLRRLMKNAL